MKLLIFFWLQNHYFWIFFTKISNLISYEYIKDKNAFEYVQNKEIK